MPQPRDHGGNSPIDVAAGGRTSVGEASLCLPRELPGVDCNWRGSPPSESKHSETSASPGKRCQQPEGSMEETDRSVSWSASQEPWILDPQSNCGPSVGHFIAQGSTHFVRLCSTGQWGEGLN